MVKIYMLFLSLVVGACAPMSDDSADLSIVGDIPFDGRLEVRN